MTAVSPFCRCGEPISVLGGGQFGPSYSAQNAKCIGCDRAGWLVVASGLCVIVVAPPDSYNVGHAWLNDVFLRRIAATEERARRASLSVPTRDKDVVMAAVPPGVDVHQKRSDNTWLRNTFESTPHELPPDPQREETLTFWAERFAELGRALGRSITRGEIANEYAATESGSDPWFAFEVNGTRIKTGWRKRVIAIKWFSTAKTPRLEALAKDRDNVTYSTYFASARDEEGRPTISGEVHAWGAEKWLEYMTALARDLQVPRGVLTVGGLRALLTTNIEPCDLPDSSPVLVAGVDGALSPLLAPKVSLYLEEGGYYSTPSGGVAGESDDVPSALVFGHPAEPEQWPDHEEMETWPDRTFGPWMSGEATVGRKVYGLANRALSGCGEDMMSIDVWMCVREAYEYRLQYDWVEDSAEFARTLQPWEIRAAFGRIKTRRKLP